MKYWTRIEKYEIMRYVIKAQQLIGVHTMLTRPKITDELLMQIRQTIDNNPEWGRERISKHLCEIWGWRSPTGQVKDISCRDMLRSLDRSGLIVLPAPKNTYGSKPRKKIEHLQHNAEPLSFDLRLLRPLQIEIIERGSALAEFKSFIDSYHYLGYGRTVGENMKYMIRSNDGAALACLLFGSAAWSCRNRDSFIGWNNEQRTSGLIMMTNNTRFLIMPWVNVKYLASHILSLISRRISTDWQEKYGHTVVLLETFVETDRFRGTCYKAANWTLVGRTIGRGRNDRKNLKALPEKDIYLLPLTRSWRENLLMRQ
jgi:hypothetical protein